MLQSVRRIVATAGVLACAAAFATPAAAQQAEKVTISGVGYAQYGFQLNNKPTGVPTPNAFDVTRSYINVVANLGEGASARITPDLYRDANGSLNVRIKYAYAQYKPKGSAVGFRFGQTQTGWLDWEEGLWGYRMQGPMAVDRAHYITSADLGLAVDAAAPDQVVNFQGGVYDGTGYHGGIGDGHKLVDGRISFRVMPTDEGGSRGGLRITGYGQYGGVVGGGKLWRAVGMVSYKSKMVLLAGEFAATSDSVTPNALVKGRVISGYGTVAIPNSKAGLIARVDVVDPNTAAAATNDRLTRIIGGVSYEIAPHILGLADIESTKTQGGTSTAVGYFHLQFSF